MLYVVALTQALTGLRWGEVSALRWEALDVDAGESAERLQRDADRLGIGGAPTTADFAPLVGLPLLRQIEATFVAPTDLGVFTEMAALRNLNLSDSPAITDASLGALAGVTQLKGLILHRTAISDATPLFAILGLERFEAAGTEIASLAEMSTWEDITTISLEDTPLASLAGVEAITTLASLDVSGTAIDDLAPLIALPNFRNGDGVDVRATALDAGDCPAILELRERNAIVTADLTCE